MSASDTKKPSVREAFKDFAEAELSQPLGKMTDKQRTLSLARFYISEIHNSLRTYISDDDFEHGCIDAASDLGVDFIHRDDRRVLVLQVKYTGQGVVAKPEDISHFHGILERLADHKLRANTRLVDALSDIDFETDSFDLRFITLGRLENQSKELTHHSVRIPSGIPDLQDRVTAEYLDERGLTAELRTALSVQGSERTNATLVAFGERARRTPILKISAAGEYDSYILIVGAPQLVNLFGQHKEALFTLNIRNYIGNTTTNKEIQKSAVERPQDFYHLNNGIACLATRITVSDDDRQLDAEGLQVINGAQTIKSLVRAARLNKWLEFEPFVLVRVTQIPEGYGQAGRLRNDIIRANNTQNVIKVSDFRSNDPVQTDLIKQFQSLKRDGRHVDYVPKRTDRVRQNAYVIRLEEFAKTIYSFLCNPIDFSGSTSFLFDESERGGYRQVFGDGKEIWTVMPADEMRLRSAIWWLAVEIDPTLKHDRRASQDSLEKAALERKWWVLFACRLVLERSFGDSYRMELSKTYKGDWKLGTGPVGLWFRQLYERARGGLVYVYKLNAQQSGFVHRNWTRNTTSVDRLRDFFKDAPIELLPRLGKSE